MSEKSNPTPAARMSSQMEAIVRLMTGKEERTIAEKMADANRPTWEQYKKDNHDKLNLSGADQQKMEEYRKELDEQREKMLAARGSTNQTNNKSKKKKKKRSKYESSDSDSTDSSEEERRRKKHKRNKKRKKKHRRRDEDSDSESSFSSEEERRRKKKKRKKSKKKEDDVDDEPEDDRYKLSSFFTKGDENDDWTTHWHNKHIHKFVSIWQCTYQLGLIGSLQIAGDLATVEDSDMPHGNDRYLEQKIFDLNC